jgi:hypothetical protein
MPAEASRKQPSGLSVWSLAADTRQSKAGGVFSSLRPCCRDNGGMNTDLRALIDYAFEKVCQNPPDPPWKASGQSVFRASNVHVEGCGPPPAISNDPTERCSRRISRTPKASNWSA